MVTANPLDPAHPGALEGARAAFTAGVQAQQAGRLDEAERLYRQALQLAPGRPSVLQNLALLLLAQGRDEAALPVLAEQLQAEPGHPAALQQRAGVLARLGRLPEALADAEAVLQRLPGSPVLQALRGQLLKDLGRPAEAAAALQAALAAGDTDPLTRWQLAALQGTTRAQGAPPLPPEGYVAALFDSYAGDFDEHLVDRLQYRAHTLLVDGLLALGAARLGHALDAGCGTGLVGPLLRPHVQHLSGVDLSARMLAQARRRGCYDALHQAELVQHLRTLPAGGCDAVLAADVLIYLGDVAPLLAAARHALAPGGWFAFTVETLAAEGTTSDDFALQPSSRYAHALPYLQRAAAAAGLAWQHHRAETLRLDQGRPVPGLGVWLRRPAHVPDPP